MRQEWLKDFSTKMRMIVTSASYNVIDEIDYATMAAYNNASMPDKLRAKSAWLTYVWHKWFAPLEIFETKSVSFQELEEIILLNEDSIFLFAVFVLKEPSERMYNLMSGEFASNYKLHCANMVAARLDNVDIDWIYPLNG